MPASHFARVFEPERKKKNILHLHTHIYIYIQLETADTMQISLILHADHVYIKDTTTRELLKRH